MFYSIQSDRTQIGGVTLIRYTDIASQQILKWGSISAALNTPSLIRAMPERKRFFSFDVFPKNDLEPDL